MPRRHTGSPDALHFLAERLRAGHVVVVPTETVYGLAADATSACACEQIFAIKRRPLSDPLIVHVQGLAQAETLADLPPAARRLAEHFWPGPLTLVLRNRSLPPIVTAGLPTVALRAPAHPLLQTLLRLCRCPLAAPSANTFARLSPTTLDHAWNDLGARVEDYLDGGPCAVGLESTILSLADPEAPQVLRPGAIAQEALEPFLEHPIAATPSGSSEQPLAPGQFPRHYSPQTPLQLFPWRGQPQQLGADAHALFLLPPDLPPAGPHSVAALDHLETAARNLYACLHTLDHSSARQLYCEQAPEHGLGIAINDRLSRASTQA